MTTQTKPAPRERPIIGSPERPILFSAPMILALLAGRKTQTRRLLKPQPTPWEDFHLEGGCQRSDWSFETGRQDDGKMIRFGLWMHCGFHPSRFQPIHFRPGIHLWVREALCARNMDLVGMLGITAPLTEVDMTRGDLACSWEADGKEIVEEHGFNMSWLWKKPRLPAMFMPRSFSRISLEVTEVRVQHLRDITEEDALAEGIYPAHENGGYWLPGVEHWNKDFPYLSRTTAREMYAALWDTMHGSGAWLRNPFVIAITFKTSRIGK